MSHSHFLSVLCGAVKFDWGAHVRVYVNAVLSHPRTGGHTRTRTHVSRIYRTIVVNFLA